MKPIILESEAALEEKLIQQLVGLGYAYVQVKDEKDVLANLKKQLEKHNGINLSESEFKSVLGYIQKGNIFEKAKTLRSRIPYTNAAGESKTLQLLDTKQWCKNEFQVAQQIVNDKGQYENRYDVTILINGLPLVQIELKRRGLAISEAFNQIKRYQRNSFAAGLGLFEYVQLFVISNGVNTKYYANAPAKNLNFKQTFYWAKENNELITNIGAFASDFLNPCHLSKMISQYIVLNETNKALMVLRPYQYYAVEAIVKQVKQAAGNGYIWHTTGSGKTLTSFKAAQIMTHLDNVHKVVFVVDRKDLDYQTAKEFNAFAKGSINSTADTKALIEHLKGDAKLIITTIQKLNNAVQGQKNSAAIGHLKDKNIVFILDECHRSQFGQTHKNITQFFKNAQLFGFTGTPILEQNANSNEFGKRTTKMLFGDCLHKYVITDAIRDENVLRFAIEYISTFKRKDDIDDSEVPAIDESEVFDAPERRKEIVAHIIKNHNAKTHNKQYTAMFCVSKVEAAVAYYQLFKAGKEKGEHDLKIATIFSYPANEDDSNNNAGKESKESRESMILSDEDLNNDAENIDDFKYARQYLDEFILDYNAMFQTNYSTESKSFYEYYNDISARVKAKEIDILIVVNMFLTGFDSKYLNTLYVDKNLQYHGLIQAYSRTNRLHEDKKSHGNIVCYRNLKNATDEAIEMFANKEAIEDIIAPPYEKLSAQFSEKYNVLKMIAPSVDAVNNLPDEAAQAEFIEAFRDVMRLMNKMKQYDGFEAESLPLSPNEFEDYKSKYLDLYEIRAKAQKAGKEKHSILDDLNFEIELIHRDEINVSYIMNLLVKLQAAPAKEKAAQSQIIQDLLNSEYTLKSKKELIAKFMEKHLPSIVDNTLVVPSFEAFLEAEKQNAMQNLVQTEALHAEKLKALVEDYTYNNKMPLDDTILEMRQEKPRLLQREHILNELKNKIEDFISTYLL